MVSDSAMSLQGRRVFLVEDEPLLLMELADIVTEIGCEGVLIQGGLRGAIQQARELPIDAAVLDINLAGENVEPLADVLDSRGIPFIFATGYSQPLLSPKHLIRVRLEKPYRTGQLVAALIRCLHSAPNPEHA